MESVKTITVFVCYARDDGRWVDPNHRHNLIDYLDRSLRRDNVEFWVDRTLEGGDEWRRQIELAIDRASIALLLVDQPFLNSDFIRSVEMPRIKARAERGDLIVMPVLTKPCTWQRDPMIESRQLLPMSPREVVPLIKCLENDASWEDARFGILQAMITQIERIRLGRGTPAAPHEVAAIATRAEDEPAPRMATEHNVAPARRSRPKMPAPLVHPVPSVIGSPQPGTLWTNSLGIKFAFIPAGEFTMGSPPDEAGRSDDETQHRVRLSKPFMLGVFPVTQAQWRAVMGDEPSRFKGDDLPVEQVSWNDAVAFCEKLSQKEGKKYRLPTEAQWEYACRAGTKTAYYTGADESALSAAGWYAGNSGSKTHPVGQKKPNAWGPYDMHGNVWECCSDWYADYSPGDAVDPTGPENGSSRVLRGGSWHYDPQFCRAAYRYDYSPGYRGIGLGFRLCLDF